MRSVVEGLIRRPAFWRADPPLPIVLVTGPEAFATVEALAEPFHGCVPSAKVREGAHGSILELVRALAGEQGDLGMPRGGSLLPPPRFPLAQFVVWAREQRDLEQKGAAGWPPDPQTHTGYQEFKKRLKEWRRGRRGGDRGVRTSADFLARAATTWVPVGTLAVWWAGGSTDLVGVLPWLLGALVALAGTAAQGALSIRGSLFTGWFGKQPYVRRNRFERLPQYALRLAAAEPEEIEQLLVHALMRDLREAYKKWIIPWPSWGRGQYALLALEAADPAGCNARFLRLVEETTEETGLLPPMVVLAAVPAVPARQQERAAKLDALPGAVEQWRQATRLRVPDLRLTVRAEAGPPGGKYGPVQPRRRRATGYWTAIGLLVALPLAWAVWSQVDRDAHCGGLRWAERAGNECVGIVNATGDTPEHLFEGEVRELVRKIDQNNAYATASGLYVSVVLFGEFTIRKAWSDDTRLAAAVSELAAVEEYQRTVSSTPRLRVLIANAGDDFGHGRRTARLITELVGQDPHVMGVVGMPRSVEGVSQAIEELHAAKIPMVASTATADSLGHIGDPAEPGGPGDPSPYYFHVAPTNFREAALGARFVRDELLAKAKKPSAIIVQDGSPADQYTNNLADDFGTALTGHGVEVLDRVSYTVRAGGISSAAIKACRLKPGVLVYAGRAAEFRDFLKDVEGKACGEVKVLAGDDVVKVVADHGREIAGMRQVQVHYMALAHRTLWAHAGAEPTAFVSRLVGGAHPDAADDNLILSYDAISVIYQAAATAYRAAGVEGTPEPGGLPSRGDILYRLSRTAGESAWEGSGGVVDFGAMDRHAPIGKVIAIMKVGGGRSHSEPVVICGTLDAARGPAKEPLCPGLPDVPPSGGPMGP
ncbi:ABC transporter substrate-binding protein [Nonomuraea sp. SBT364]|uniref:ABC transporter substrate-binding protein n=1 Tax=Nonomuraea sp. SBT364 TaxID=1580530 RepID=UPI0012E21987|nr:ABC transporter substrate-binding protein [Nonomuraea sp. SBT364]